MLRWKLGFLYLSIEFKVTNDYVLISSLHNEHSCNMFFAKLNALFGSFSITKKPPKQHDIILPCQIATKSNIQGVDYGLFL